MWGRLKRRILRTKAGGGVYHSSSHDDEFSDSRDTYRDFREELYDDSRGTGSWKDGGGKSGKRMSLTKTPFPNLDRCSCGTPGGRDLQENVAKSETLRRKNDFILGADGKSCNQTKGRIAGKANNEYTSTSTGPGTRCRTVGDDGGGEQRLRASTSTGQIPCGAQSEEHARNEWNNRRRNGHSPGAPERRRRLAYSDDDDAESESEEEDDEEEEEEEEEERVPSTSQAFRNSSQSDGTKSSSNSSDYTPLAFDLNYVKVSPPKLRRRRKKNGTALSASADKNSAAPLMVRRERRPFPEISASSSCDRLLSLRAMQSQRPVGESGNREEGTMSDVLRTDSFDVGGLLNRTSKDGEVQSSATPSKSDASCRQPAVLLSSFSGAKPQQQQFSEYVAWADIHNPPQVTSLEGGRNICEVSGRVGDERGNDERVVGRGREISTSGSVLQFTFTVRLDNDVIRGTRRDVEGSSGAVGGGSGSSMVSGRVDILNHEKPGGASVSGRGNVLSLDQHQGYIPGSESMGLLQRSFKVQLQEEGAQVGTQNVTSSQETARVMFAESANVSIEPRDGVKDPNRPGFKDPTPSVSQQQQIVQASGENGLDRWAKTGNVAVGVNDRQQRLEEDFVSSQGSRMTTVAIVHKSASDNGDREENGTLLSSTKELDATDGRDDHSHAVDPVPEAKSGLRKAFDEVDCCVAENGLKSHQCQASPPLASSSAAEDESELTHMSWEEVMKEAQSLGIPLTRPSGSSGDKARQPMNTDHQVVFSSSSPPSKQGPSLQDVYWVCSSCTENMQHQSSSPTARKTPPSKTSSPFKEKFKLQSIFGGSSGGGGGGGSGGGGGKKPKEEKTCRGQATTSSSPLNRKGQSSKYRTMPIPSGTAAKDVILWSGQNCTCTTSRSLQKARQRSLSPVSSTRCSQAVQSSPKSTGLWGRGGDRRGQRVSHLCSPPLLRCRFPSSGRTIQSSVGQSSSWNLKKSAHLSSEMLTNSSSPVIRRANDNDRDFLKSLAQLMGCSWYWGTLSFEAAEAELIDRPDGAFLVRDSSDDRYILSVSFRSQRSTHHVRIERHNGMFSFSSEHGLHESPDIVEFVENAVELSQSGQCLYYLRPRQLNSTPVPVQLIYPVSRFAH